MNQILMGRYKIVRELGRGGMGIVYQALDVRTHHKVAVKIMNQVVDAEEVARFTREIETLSMLSHPNIVRVMDAGSLPDQRPYLVMEYIPGLTLEQAIQRNELSLLDIVDIMEQLARAIAHTHDHGILHRDLKPQNILIAAHTKRPTLLDFGLSRFHKPEQSAASLTEEGTILGTLSYMSPEQAEGLRVNKSADIYGLAATFYFALTHKAPFSANGTYSTLKAVIGDKPVPPSKHKAGIPKALEELCLRNLSKDPKHRAPSAFAFAEQLSDADWTVNSDSEGKYLRYFLLVSIVVLASVSIFSWPRPPIPPKLATCRLKVNTDKTTVRWKLGKKEHRANLSKDKWLTIELEPATLTLRFEREGITVEQRARAKDNETIETAVDLTGKMTIRAKEHFSWSLEDNLHRPVFYQDRLLTNFKGSETLSLPMGKYHLIHRGKAIFDHSQLIELLPHSTSDTPRLLETPVSTTSSFNGRYIWAPPSAADLDNDGVKDLLVNIALQDRSKPSAAEFLAISGKDGKALWRSAAAEGNYRSSIPVHQMDEKSLPLLALNRRKLGDHCLILLNKRGRGFRTWSIEPKQPRAGIFFGTIDLQVDSKTIKAFVFWNPQCLWIVDPNRTEQPWLFPLSMIAAKSGHRAWPKDTMSNCEGAILDLDKDGKRESIAWEIAQKQLIVFQPKVQNDLVSIEMRSSNSLTEYISRYYIKAPNGRSFLTLSNKPKGPRHMDKLIRVDYYEVNALGEPLQVKELLTQPGYGYMGTYDGRSENPGGEFLFGVSQLSPDNQWSSHIYRSPVEDAGSLTKTTIEGQVLYIAGVRLGSGQRAVLASFKKPNKVCLLDPERLTVISEAFLDAEPRAAGYQLHKDRESIVVWFYGRSNLLILDCHSPLSKESKE